MGNYLDIEKKVEDFKSIRKEVWRAEKGIRAIGLMYHEHSSDKSSFDNIFILKDNIEYRLFSAVEQYSLFIQELEHAESRLQFLSESRDENKMPLPVLFREVEIKLSSIFDSMIFHLSSVFDYLAHIICYIHYKNKQKTDYWTRLAKKVRDPLKGKHNFCHILDELDRTFVGRLYDYRSRLLHNKRDIHSYNFTHHISSGKHTIHLLSSEASLKHFPTAKEEKDDKMEGITLTYLSSWLLRESLSTIECLLDAIKIDLDNNSHFIENIQRPKGDKPFTIVSYNPETKMAEPISKGIWNEYKKEH